MTDKNLFNDAFQEVSFKEKNLETLLRKNPALWKGGSQAINERSEGISSGYQALDAILPWQGWPRQGLVEIISAPDIGEFHLVIPLLHALSQKQQGSVWIAPPHTPYAPALLQAGIALEHVFIVQPRISSRETLWSLEKALQTADCPLVLGWLRQLNIPVLRRLQLAAQTGHTLGVLFHQRPVRNSPSELQLGVQPGKLCALQRHLEVRILRARGSHRQLSAVISTCR
jgi:hypothetical protein